MYLYVVFFYRRMLVAFGLVIFYKSSNAQIAVVILTSVFVLLYQLLVMPYKEKTLNRFSVFNEL